MHNMSYMFSMYMLPGENRTCRRARFATRVVDAAACVCGWGVMTSACVMWKLKCRCEGRRGVCVSMLGHA